jgi:KaiC/GvpD/RAD55 family RecA-like ATPase
MERVFKWFTREGGDPKANIYTDWFARYFEPKDFDGIDRILMCYLKYCAKLSVTPRKEILSAYLKVDGKHDIKEYNVRTDTMTSLDYRESSQLEEAYQIISGAAQSTFDNYCSVDLTDREFKVDMYDFMTEKRSDRIQQVMMEAYPRLSDGSDISDVSADLRNSLAELDDVYDTNKIKDVDYTTEGSEGSEMHFLCKTGIPAIDGDIGGIYTRLIYTFNGQPGSGKSRFVSSHFVYRVLTEAKKDVLLYALELSQDQVRNMLIAYHITRVYGGRIKIPDSLMNKREEMTDEQRQIYESAKIDLFESGNYGKLYIKEELIVERFRDEVMSVIKASGNMGLIAVDYAGIAESQPESKWDKKLDGYEIITQVYINVRKILKAVDVSSVIVNQYNDKGIDAAYAGKPIRSGYVQGGHIVQRHTDYDLSMTFTEEQELAKVRMLSVSKRRGSAGFSNVMLSTDLSVSIFRQELST